MPFTIGAISIPSNLKSLLPHRAWLSIRRPARISQQPVKLTKIFLTKQLEMDLAPLTSDMWGTQKWLEERGFRVERGNKSHSSWWLAARNRNTGQRIKVESDGTKLVVTPDG